MHLFIRSLKLISVRIHAADKSAMKPSNLPKKQRSLVSSACTLYALASIKQSTGAAQANL
jgi:hypothetical protein